MIPSACPCGALNGKGKPLEFRLCCGPVLADPHAAVDAHALMRSRYTAYVIGDEPHLLATWHPTTRPAACAPDPDTRWLGLHIKSHHTGEGTQATVHFVERYREGGRGHRLEEVSQFVREGGQWFYVSGSQP